ncbi:hypothetical protein B0H67DRAFT_686968 [Lasiosphaeris hirsuta]|uniref:Uncharacterized protein n=1 Tax=Lasiosphaeris hirsuta TaxID=260670 RepID=A0AA40DKZ4_9PEZI|nr:hypothetical protein B0H67DRAFT_686968 [Lasiosphaeris hirsuta]
MRRVQNCWKAQFSFLTDHPKELYRPLPQIIIATMVTKDLTMLVTYTKRGHMIDDALKHLFVIPCFVKMLMTRARYDEEEVIRDNNEKAERARLGNHRCVILARLKKYFGEALPFMFSDVLEQHDSGDDLGDDSGDDEMDLDSEDLDPLTKFTLECRDVFASKPGASDRA